MVEAPMVGRRAARANRRPWVRRGTVAWVLAMVALAAVFLAPFYWLLATALKTLPELGAYPIHLWPARPQWDNVRAALTMINYGRYATNSFFLAGLSMVLTVLTSASVGFGFARLRGRGKGPLFVVMLATTMLPPILLVIPTYVLFTRLHLVYTYWPWVLWGLGSTPIMSFLFRQFFAGIPLDLEDAAIIDGCGYGRIFWRIFLPLSKPVIATVAIFSFQFNWDDFFRPLIFLGVDNTTLAVAMASGYSDPHGDVLTNVLAAGTTIYALPVIVLFFIAQRFFVQGIVTTGLKG